MKNKIVYICPLIASILLILAALARALSINNLVIAESTGDISKHYAASVLIDWGLSSTLLLLTGIWLLFLLRDLKRAQRRAWLQAIIIGLALTLFGSSFWYRYPSSFHLPFFLFMGLIILIPLLIYGKQFNQ
jgi:uncharacterized membrane protein SirB2